MLSDNAIILVYLPLYLLAAFGLHQDQVEKVFQKQSSVQEMFEKRRISLKKLAAKQTRPVQPVAPRPEVKSPLSSPSKPEHTDDHLMKKQHRGSGLISPGFLSVLQISREKREDTQQITPSKR